jgi:hypothetical protein
MGHVLQSGCRCGDEFEIGLAAAKLSVSFRPSVLVSAGDGTLRRQPGRGSQEHVSHAAMFTATGCCATVEIINYRPFAAAIVIFVRSVAS